MIFQIEIFNKPGYKDHHAEHVKHDIENLGLKHDIDVRYMPVYQLEGDINLREINNIVKELLIDPITQESSIKVLSETETPKAPKPGRFEVEVWFKPGVTDTVSDSVKKAVKDLGINGEFAARTGHKYVLSGSVTEELAKQIAEKLLANTMVQRYIIK